MERRDYSLNPNQFDFRISCVDTDGTVIPVMSWKFDCPTNMRNYSQHSLSSQLRNKILFYMKEKTKDSLWNGYSVAKRDGVKMKMEIIDTHAKTLDTRHLLNETFEPENVNINMYTDKGQKTVSISFDKIWRNFNCFFLGDMREKAVNADLSEFDDVRSEYYEIKRLEGKIPDHLRERYENTYNVIFEGLSTCIKRHLGGNIQRQNVNRKQKVGSK